MTNLVILLLRTYLTTNFVPEYYSGPPPTVATNRETGLTYLVPSTMAVAVRYLAHTVIVTNYVLGVRRGTNCVELLTLRRE